MEVLHLHCPVKDCARFLFLGCSPMCLYFCLFKFRPALIPQTPLWRSVGYHCSTAQTLARNPGWRAISILSPTAASIRWSLVMVTVGHSAPYRQELLLSTGSNLSVATGCVRLDAQQEPSPALRVCRSSLQTRSQSTSCDTWKEKSCFSSRSNARLQVEDFSALTFSCPCWTSQDVQRRSWFPTDTPDLALIPIVWCASGGLD